ncbi:glutamine--tRNA ligase isoform X2 [Ananas comosus]|uniref:glutamine--tRNA ligase n=1 Tax=Ananas comosus TaxID=4615 RepID=A0A6P5FWR1_ANACO|nr:glutamine--tRNA ligase isoform X2 [Ananas comosus]
MHCVLSLLFKKVTLLVIVYSDNSMIHIDRLEYYIREELNKTAPRTTVVLHPVKVVITNLDNESIINVDAKKWPAALSNDGSSYYKVPFTSILYIERSDFRKNDSKDYYGLAPGKSVLLRYAFPIKCTDVIYGDDENSVIEIHAEYDFLKKTKPKGVLHWVAQPSPGVEPLKVEVRLFEKLFLSENPAELEDWLSDPNPNSKEVTLLWILILILRSLFSTELLLSGTLIPKVESNRLNHTSKLILRNCKTKNK